MELYIMMKAGGTEKYLVMIVEGAYNTFSTLQEIEYSICKTWQAHTTLVRSADDLVGIDAIYLINSQGLRRWEVD